MCDQTFSDFLLTVSCIRTADLHFLIGKERIWKGKMENKLIKQLSQWGSSVVVTWRLSPTTLSCCRGGEWSSRGMLAGQHWPWVLPMAGECFKAEHVGTCPKSQCSGYWSRWTGLCNVKHSLYNRKQIKPSIMLCVSSSSSWEAEARWFSECETSLIYLWSLRPVWPCNKILSRKEKNYSCWVLGQGAAGLTVFTK